MRHRVFMLLAVATVWLAWVPLLPAADWERIGELTVDFATDRDAISVAPTRGPYDTIKLKVHRNGIEVLDLRVTYANGSSHDVSVRSFIPAGGESRLIDLPGQDRVIRKIELVYRSRGGSGRRAVVKVYGIRGDAPPPHGAVTTRWQALGERTIGAGVDRDSIPVASSETGWRLLKLEVLSGDLDLLELSVVFGNGEVEQLEVRRHLKPGEESRPLDLPGERRQIRRVDLVGRRGSLAAGPTVVRLWGAE